MAPSKKNTKKPTVNPELKDFDARVSEFGELETSYNIEDINEFLNKRLKDKKLIDRKDYKAIRKGKKGPTKDE